jgi:hypothetical protein
MFLTVGIAILAIVLVLWRRSYEWLISLSAFRERVYVLGSGERARTIVNTLRNRRDAGIEVVEGQSNGDSKSGLDRFAADLRASAIRSLKSTASSLPWRTVAELCRFVSSSICA